MLVEQSFKDFGESDAVVLIRGGEEIACSVFVEAKVKTFQREDWHVCDEFGEFRKGANHKVSSSNPFTQLYHKVRLVRALREGGIQRVRQGVQFPPCSTKPCRRIGSNRVVLHATELLQAHLGQVFYIAIVPDTDHRAVATFFAELRTAPHSSLADTWDVTTYGYLTWSQVRDSCKQTDLSHALRVFDFNEGQLYRM